MATIKSFTDLRQSKKLAEFLLLESADMCFNTHNNMPPLMTPYRRFKEFFDMEPTPAFLIPCWSLVALLDVLPDEVSLGEGYQNKYEIKIRRYYGGNNITLYQIAYGNNKGSSGNWHDMINTSEQEKFVDVCYEMIIKLHEQNLL